MAEAEWLAHMITQIAPFFESRRRGGGAQRALRRFGPDSDEGPIKAPPPLRRPQAFGRSLRSNELGRQPLSHISTSIRVPRQTSYRHIDMTPLSAHSSTGRRGFAPVSSQDASWSVVLRNIANHAASGDQQAPPPNDTMAAEERCRPMPHRGKKGGAHDERTRECRVCGQGKKMLFRCKWRKNQRQWEFGEQRHNTTEREGGWIYMGEDVRGRAADL